MKSIYFSIKEHANRVYFWNKFIFTLILFSIWLSKSEIYINQSLSSIDLLLMVSMLSLIIFGAIFKNHDYNTIVIQTFLIVDIANCQIFLFPNFQANLLSGAIIFILFANTVLFLKAKDRFIVVFTFFGLLICMMLFHILGDDIGSKVNLFGSLLLYSIITYGILVLIMKSLDNYEKEIKKLRSMHIQLIHDHNKLSKEIKLTSKRVGYLSRDIRKKSFGIQDILNITDQFGNIRDSKKIISPYLLTIMGQLGCWHALFLGDNQSLDNCYKPICQKGIHDGRINNFKIHKDSFIIQILKAVREPILMNDISYERLSAEEQEFVKFFKDNLLCPVGIRDRIMGMFIIGNKITGKSFTKEDYNLITIYANQAAFILEQSDINNDIYDFYNKTVRTLVGSLETKYSYSKGHAIRTLQYVHALGERMNLSFEDLKNLTVGTVLHDIGKIGLKDDILFYDKQIKSEDNVIKNRILDHALIGAALLKSSGFKESLTEPVLHHHEWVNGQGYPHGLKGKDISLNSRILSVCNAYDGMLSERPHRKSLAKDEAVAQLRMKAGIQFDADVVNMFLGEIEKNKNLGKLSERH